MGFFFIRPLDGLLFFIRPLDGLLFFIRPLDGLVFKEVTFANSRGWLSKMNAASIEISDDYKTMSDTTIQIFQPQSMLQCQIILKKNTILIIYCLEKKPIGFFSRWASSRNQGNCASVRGVTARDS